MFNQLGVRSGLRKGRVYHTYTRLPRVLMKHLFAAELTASHQALRGIAWIVWLSVWGGVGALRKKGGGTQREREHSEGKSAGDAR